MEVVVSLSQGRTAAARCGLFTHKSVPVTFEPPCSIKEDQIFHSVVFESIILTFAFTGQWKSRNALMTGAIPPPTPFPMACIGQHTALHI